MITYQQHPNGTIYVYLEGRHVGTIRLYPLGWQYKPIGGDPGDFYTTLAECKASLESPDDDNEEHTPDEGETTSCDRVRGARLRQTQFS